MCVCVWITLKKKKALLYFVRGERTRGHVTSILTGLKSKKGDRKGKDSVTRWKGDRWWERGHEGREGGGRVLRSREAA